jgi:hypothetical protein
MLLNNDTFGRWVNGSIGKIVGIIPKNGEDDVIQVELSDGNIVNVTPFNWEIYKYSYDDRTQKIFSQPAGSFTQYPLKLAWALTIHKSQGKTFHKVVIDIGRGTFAHGQVYVALSRCTSLQGIILLKPIQKRHILMDFRVVQFLTRLQYQKAEERLSYENKVKIILSAIAEKEEVEIVYLKTDDTKSRRRIRPQIIEPMEYKGKQFEGLRAFCHKRRDIRHFRIDRILELTTNG